VSVNRIWIKLATNRTMLPVSLMPMSSTTLFSTTIRSKCCH